MDNIDLNFLEYEISSSWWSGYIWFDWGKQLAADYFLCKTKRKYKKYMEFKLKTKK